MDGTRERDDIGGAPLGLHQNKPYSSPLSCCDKHNAKMLQGWLCMQGPAVCSLAHYSSRWARQYPLRALGEIC